MSCSKIGGAKAGNLGNKDIKLKPKKSNKGVAVKKFIIKKLGRLVGLKAAPGKFDWDDLMKSIEVEMVDGMQIAQLPCYEQSRSRQSKVRRCILGTTPDVPAALERKTILVVGESGTGKSTMMNGFINYLLNVTFEDNYRFRLVDPYKDCLNNARDDGHSQTEFITVYDIPLVHGTSPYAVTLIDTPGFGDTRGRERDDDLVSQLDELFNNREEFGVQTIDAVCFLVKASTNRLTTTQKYIFDSVLRVFGNDIKDNITVLVTFGETGSRQVLKCLREGGVEFKNSFIFNNNILFAPSQPVVTDIDACDQNEGLEYLKKFWKMCFDSYAKFFKFLDEVEAKSLVLSAEVLQKRKDLLVRGKYLHIQICKLCEEADKKEQEKAVILYYTQQKHDNRHFVISADVKDTIHAYGIPPSEKAVCCKKCYHTCHYPCFCDLSQGVDKCDLFDNSSRSICERCPGEQCSAADHVISQHVYRPNYKTVDLELPPVKKAFQTAEEKLAYYKEKLKETERKYEQAKGEVIRYIQEMVRIRNQLAKIALKPALETELSYIQNVIKEELHEQKSGHYERVRIMRSVMEYFHNGEATGMQVPVRVVKAIDETFTAS